MLLVTCPCAFRRRRLTQNTGRGIRVRHFPSKFPHQMPLVTCPCAFRLRRLAQNSGGGVSVRHFPSKFPHQMPLVTCPCAFRLCRLPQNAGRIIVIVIIIINHIIMHDLFTPPTLFGVSGRDQREVDCCQSKLEAYQERIESYPFFPHKSRARRQSCPGSGAPPRIPHHSRRPTGEDWANWFPL